jgi:hypothetical protein
LIRRQLGAEGSEAVERLTSDTLALFRALTRSVPSDAPQVQDTLARRARWSVLSAHYALRAAELGLETDAGQRCLDLSLKLDARAERLDVTALDLASRLDAAKPPTDNPVLRAIEAAGRHAGALSPAQSTERASARKGAHVGAQEPVA